MIIKGRTRFKLRKAKVNTADIGATLTSHKVYEHLKIIGVYIGLWLKEGGSFRADSLNITLYVRHAILASAGKFSVDYLDLKDTKSISISSAALSFGTTSPMEYVYIPKAQFFFRNKGKTVLTIGGVSFPTFNVHLFELGVNVNNSAQLKYLINAENLRDSKIGSPEFPITRQRIGDACIKVWNPRGQEGAPLELHIARPYPVMEIEGDVRVIKH